jgi:hypothetical protein
MSANALNKIVEAKVEAMIPKLNNLGNSIYFSSISINLTPLYPEFLFFIFSFLIICICIYNKKTARNYIYIKKKKSLYPPPRRS